MPGKSFKLMVSCCMVLIFAEPVYPGKESTTANKQLDNLLAPDSQTVKGALAAITKQKDKRFIAPLIEIVHACQIGLLPNGRGQRYISALHKISGKNFGWDFPAWVEWYGATELKPPPGFIGWKGRLLSGIDPQFGRFLNNDDPSRIRAEEILWGGVRVDGIPALDNPKTIRAQQAGYLIPNEPVFGIAIKGDARAYPLRIMDWHEMANDVVGGVHVSLAYCTLCGSGIAYNGKASDGKIYTFGSSGLLYRSNKLMYDRQTRTLWNHLTGIPVLGKLAKSEIKLEILPMVLTTWQQWQQQYPNTKVLDIDTGYKRDYNIGASYVGYFASKKTMFPVWRQSKKLPAKSRVYAISLDGKPKAYPLTTLIDKKVVNDTIGKNTLVVIVTGGRVITKCRSMRSGAHTYSSGAQVRAYQRNNKVFRSGPDAGTIIDHTSRSWRITEDALIGPAGQKLPRINGFLAYWFAWYAFNPKTLLYQQ